jgi:hypothetical protein
LIEAVLCPYLCVGFSWPGTLTRDHSIAITYIRQKILRGIIGVLMLKIGARLYGIGQGMVDYAARSVSIQPVNPVNAARSFLGA